MFYSWCTFCVCLLLYEVFQNSISKIETIWNFYMKAGLYPSKFATSWQFSATFYQISFPPMPLILSPYRLRQVDLCHFENQESIGARVKELNSDVARFTTHESNLSCNKSGCCKLCEYWLLIGLNYTGVASLAPKQVCFGLVKRRTFTDFAANQ